MIKRLHSGFKTDFLTVNDSSCLAVSASFLTGAAAAIFYMHSCGTQYCMSVLSASAVICAVIIIQTIILGCSVIGGAVLPVCSALYGALVCMCSAAVKLQGRADIKHIAVFAVMTPVFFVTAAEGMLYADCVSESRYARPADPGSEKFIVYACVSLVITVGVLRAAYF